MKSSNLLGSLALGVLIGGGIGYLIASDPKKKEKVQGFIDNVEGKMNETVAKIKTKLKGAEELTDEEITAVNDALATDL
jgi:hypothetical protein